ncbi:MAG: radical SAM family heme chaperone HemW [Thermomicrobiales bacterium]|nr:radical SAM family heme chaperone HemW [Thermomicrobiales bacterium]
MAPLPPDAPVGIYIHIPFCAHICPYCDFNTYSGQEALIPRYLSALERDIAVQATSVAGRTATSVFFGGGTPSLIAPDRIGELIRACRAAVPLTGDAEITLEANPNSVDEAYFAGLRLAGVNRLSLGVQTVDRRGLRVLGRQHEAADAEAAYLAARRAGFDNISLDLIFGWPGQTVDAWRSDLERVLSWGDGGPEHLSLYGLIVEPGTPMADAVARGILSVIDDDGAADLYELAIEVMAAAGYIHYEVANWARSESLASRHNTIYWRSGDYLGIGAGAHGTVAGRRTMSHLLPKTYIEAVESGGSPFSNVEDLSQRVRMGETMMLGLRLLREGVTDTEFRARYGVGLDEVFDPTIEELVQIGMIARDDDRIRLTHRGLMLSNDVCARFVE